MNPFSLFLANRSFLPARQSKKAAKALTTRVGKRNGFRKRMTAARNPEKAIILPEERPVGRDA